MAPAAVIFSLPSIIGTVIINLAVNYIVQGAVINVAIQQVRGQGLRLESLGEVTAVLGNLTIVALLQTFAATMGLILCILPGFVVMGLLMFSVPLVVDQKLGGVEAISRSFEMLKSQWLMATLFYIVVTILGYIGLLLYYVGLILTLPFLFLSLAVAYNDFVQGAAQA